MKNILPILLLFGCAANLSSMTYEEYLQAKYNVEQLKGRQAARRGAYLGARIGSMVGSSAGATATYLVTEEPVAIPVGGAIGGVVGALGAAGTGAVIGASISAFSRWKINKVLQTYTTYTFNTLPIDAAIMVVAAYRKNTKQMQQMASKVQDFLHEPGIWETLTHLYFGQLPTVTLMVQLKSMLMTA